MKIKKDENVLDEKNLVQLVDDKFKEGKHDSIDRQNYINLAYFIGQQWLQIDPTTNNFSVPPLQANEIRYTANKIKPIVRTELSKLLKNKPVSNVMPFSSDDDDIQSAHVAEKIVEALDFTLKLRQVDKELVLWALTTGTSFIKPYWDNSKGIEIAEGLNEGDVNLEVVNLFELYFDSTAKKFDEVAWVIHTKTRTIDYVKQVYNKEVASESNILNSNMFDAKLGNLNNINNVSINKAKDSVIVKEYWEKPNGIYKKGRRITVANGVLLYYVEDIGFGEKDTSERQLPFFEFNHIEVPGRVFAQSVIEDLIPVQRERNRSRSQIIANKDLFKKPKILIEEGSIEDELTDEDEIIYYMTGTQKPDYLRPPSTGSDAYENIKQCDDELFFISGQSEVAHGSLPNGQKLSGIGLSVLNEQDDSKLSPTTQSFESCKSRYMSYLLKIIKNKYDIERTLKFCGKNNQFQAVTFLGSELTSTDVRVVEGSALPQSKTAKQEFVMTLIDKGVLNPQFDKNTIVSMLEIGNSDALYDEYNIDVNQALSEQDKYKQGDISAKVRDFYNHEAHIKTHNRFRKSEDYEKLDEQLQMIIDNHVMEHEQFISMKKQEELMAQMPPQEEVQEPEKPFQNGLT